MTTTHLMLDLSLGHLSPRTIHFLDEQDSRDDIPSLILYEKALYGYFIPLIPEEEDGQTFEERGYPEDLIRVLRFAMERGCSWLMLDVDGEMTDQLPFWDDASGELK